LAWAPAGSVNHGISAGPTKPSAQPPGQGGPRSSALISSCGPRLVASRQRLKQLDPGGRVVGRQFSTSGHGGAERSWCQTLTQGRVFVSGRRELIPRPLEAFPLQVEADLPDGRDLPPVAFTTACSNTEASKVVRGGCGLRPDAGACAQTKRVVLKERTNSPYSTPTSSMVSWRSPGQNCGGESVRFISLALVLPALRRLLVRAAEAVVRWSKPSSKVGKARVARRRGA